MAAARTKTAPIGSAQWIQSERDQAGQFVDQEVEEFSYSVRNEMEWLNEHMADVFSQNQVSLADIFKTPGKLRGKTPRTTRKRDVLEQRQPLTDIFAPNLQNVPTPAKNTAFYDKIAQVQIPEDGEDHPPMQRPINRANSPRRVGKPGNTDSGYHGMTEDEMEVDGRVVSESQETIENEPMLVPVRDDQPPPQRVNQSLDDATRTSADSFVSAKEVTTSRAPSTEQMHRNSDSDNATVPDEEMALEPEQAVSQEEPAEVQPEEEDLTEEMGEENVEEESRSLSDASTPEKSIQRKSSFNFSSLPAREPLAAKRSIGGRGSQVDLQNRNSVLAKSLSKSFGPASSEQTGNSQENSDTAKTQVKTSAQILHERISMLGKTKDARTSKSLVQNTLYPQLPSVDAEEGDSHDMPPPPPKDSAKDVNIADDDEDDWIAPTRTSQPKSTVQPSEPVQSLSQQEARPTMHQKSISTTHIPSPTRMGMVPDLRHQKANSVSNPSLKANVQSTTPAGSPMAKKYHDGPLSASKNRLWSALKSAKSIFASSASASAAAKLEAHNNSPAFMRSPKRDYSDESKMSAIGKMPGALYSDLSLPQSPTRAISVISASPSRKTRSSTESDKKRDKALKSQQKATAELEKVREKERQKATKEQEERQRMERAEAARREKQQAATQIERSAFAESIHPRDDMPPPPPPKSMLPGKLKTAGKPIRPTRQAANTKPTPVNIRIASQSSRLGQGPPQASLSSSQNEGLAPPPPPKTGLRPGSALGNSHSTSAASNNSRVKALEAAARKKEQEEREKQRKAEAKRELEKKRAAKVEEDRRLEAERKAMEDQRRAQEAKLAAQRLVEKQAADSKRREQQRLEQQRLEQQRQQEAAQRSKAAHDLAESIQRERMQQQQAPRNDAAGTIRQLAQKMVPDFSGRPPIQPNPAKPAKRTFQNENEEEWQQSQRPGVQRAPPSYQQNEAKRRRTNENDEEVEQRPSVMAPPKRPSTMRKETLTKVPYGYAHAPAPTVHQPASMFKTAVNAQHQLQHGQRPTHPSQTVQLSNARIPFAENANPPATQQHAPSSHLYPGYENAAPGPAGQSKFKTPARPAQAPKSAKSAKSSPLYQNGDNIALPEIATDSEEEDSEDEDTGFRAPSWVASPALRELLTQQQLVDPETVFGPIGELKMDEVFRGAKAERMKRFRDRGSSAAWVQTGDAITSAEKRRDMEMRERVVKEGGWRYEPAPSER